MRFLAPLACAALAMATAGCAGAPEQDTPAERAGQSPADLPTAQRTRSVASLAELQAALDAAAAAYRTHGPIRVARSGREGVPIVIRAATVGGAEIGGTDGFALDDAAHVVVYGFRFTHGGTQAIPTGSHHVRFARNIFQLGDSVRHWLQVSGDDAEVDHNTFPHKRTLGVYLTVEGPRDDMAKRTWIHHNYFHDHQFDGSNGGESIRIGLSWRSLWSALTVVEHNLFERADGDPEAISNKSSDNVIRHNTIRNSEGCIVLRHGNRVAVAGNFVLDSGCGIRVYGIEHRIHNSHVSGSAGNVIANNLVQGDAGALVSFGGNAPVGFRWEGNLFWGGGISEHVPRAGNTLADPRLVRDASGLFRLSPGSPAVDAATGSTPEVRVDMDGQARPVARDVGADEYSTGAIVLRPLTPSDVGPHAP